MSDQTSTAAPATAAPQPAPAADDAATTAQSAPIAASAETAPNSGPGALPPAVPPADGVDPPEARSSEAAPPANAFERNYRHKNGRPGRLAGIRRNRNGQIEALRLQIGAALTEWMPVGEFIEAD